MRAWQFGQWVACHSVQKVKQNKRQSTHVHSNGHCKQKPSHLCLKPCRSPHTLVYLVSKYHILLDKMIKKMSEITFVCILWFIILDLNCASLLSVRNFMFNVYCLYCVTVCYAVPTISLYVQRPASIQWQQWRAISVSLTLVFLSLLLNVQVCGSCNCICHQILISHSIESTLLYKSPTCHQSSSEPLRHGFKNPEGILWYLAPVLQQC